MGDGKVSATLSSPPSPPIPKIPAVTSTVLAAPLASPLPRLPLVTRVALLADLLCIVSVVSLSAPNANCNRVAMAISPSGINPAVGSKLSPGSPESLTLANWICCKLLKFDSLIGESVLKYLWHHQDAILCCSLKSVPVFIFANQAGLDKLETTLVALQDITWVFRGRQRKLEDTFQKNSNMLKLLVFLREPRATTRPCFTVHPPSATVATPAPPLGRHRVAPAIHLSSSIFPFLSPVPIPYFPGSPFISFNLV
ncbi:Homeobox-leucine zipper protein REVOLUTA [Arachis hypogaea]|nr:Homeobox-leucine zipper protein REVOLUTA [Arachis hypogaea]